MELNIAERLLILNLDTLPMVGNIITMRLKQQLVDDLGFSEEELKETGLRTEEEGRVKWDKDIVKDVWIGDAARELILKAIDKSENLNAMYVPLYDKLLA